MKRLRRRRSLHFPRLFSQGPVLLDLAGTAGMTWGSRHSEGHRSIGARSVGGPLGPLGLPWGPSGGPRRPRRGPTGWGPRPGPAGPSRRLGEERCSIFVVRVLFQ